nr:unnamed protein product [Callosobruchus chinensis]
MSAIRKPTFLAIGHIGFETRVSVPHVCFLFYHQVPESLATAAVRAVQLNIRLYLNINSYQSLGSLDKPVKVQTALDFRFCFFDEGFLLARLDNGRSSSDESELLEFVTFNSLSDELRCPKKNLPRWDESFNRNLSSTRNGMMKKHLLDSMFAASINSEGCSGNINIKYFNNYKLVLTLDHSRRHLKQNWCIQESEKHLFEKLPKHIAQFGGGDEGVEQVAIIFAMIKRLGMYQLSHVLYRAGTWISGFV